MSLQIVFLLALSSSAAQGPVLCAGIKSQIEPDMQILESDLDRAAASAAASKLQEMIGRGELSGEFYFGVMNQLKIVQGHTLLHQAQSDRREFGAKSSEAKDSTLALCNWLSTEGFWYD